MGETVYQLDPNMFSTFTFRVRVGHFTLKSLLDEVDVLNGVDFWFKWYSHKQLMIQI